MDNEYGYRAHGTGALNPDNYEPRGDMICEYFDCDNTIYSDYAHSFGGYRVCADCYETLIDRDMKIKFIAATLGIKMEESEFLKFLGYFAVDHPEEVDVILEAYIEESEHDFYRWAVTGTYKNFEVPRCG